VKVTIDTDTRQLKLGADGLYRSGGGKLPCDHCGWKIDCPLQPLKACSLFLPTIPFTDETGLRKVANTVRVGVAWTQRLKPGQAVALYNSKAKEIFGHATVLSTHSGGIGPMLKEHAHANHLMLDTPPNEAPHDLWLWQRQNYGPRIIHNDTKITAIYLLRLREPPASPNFQGDEARRSVESGATSSRQNPGDGDRNQDSDR
jgi:hypothetical protein